MTTNLQHLMQDMNETPITIYVCIVNYTDGTSRAWTFSDQLLLEDYLEYLEYAGEELGAVSFQYFSSLLDASSDVDYTCFGTYH